MATNPNDVIREHPRHSNVLSLKHFDKDINDVSPIWLQYAVLIISRLGHPEAIDEMPTPVVPAHLNNKRLIFKCIY